MSEQPLGRELSLNSRDDLCYLEALADQAPHLSSRIDIPDCLTDFWRTAIKGLIAVAKEAESRSRD